jgi:hypothetical protein
MQNLSNDDLRQTARPYRDGNRAPTKRNARALSKRARRHLCRLSRLCDLIVMLEEKTSHTG